MHTTLVTLLYVTLLYVTLLYVTLLYVTLVINYVTLLQSMCVEYVRTTSTPPSRSLLAS
jgi:hypothetical protein